MERLLVLAVTVILANSQTHYSYFNIHRAEVAPLPTFRPFNHNLDPLLVTPSSVGGTSEVPGVPPPVETATAAPTAPESATSPSTQEGASQLPNSFYFNSFEQHRGNQQFNPFLFNGFNSLSHNEAKSISASVPQVPQSTFQNFPNLPRSFPGQPFGQGFPFTGFNQFPRQFPQVTPQVNTFFRGPQGHYHQVHNQNPFGFGYNPYQGILPPPIIYQIIYYNIPAGNETANNGTEVTDTNPEATTKGSVVVEIPTVPSTSSRIVEEVTPKATTSSSTTTSTTTTTAPTTTTTTTTAPTTTTSASTTTTESSETEGTTVTTEATTTTSTENTTEK